MKKGIPVIIGIVVFAAILVGWFFTLPSTLSRASKGSYGTLAGITSEGFNLFEDIKEAQTNINKGVEKMNDLIIAAYIKDAAIANLKTKLESEAKIKAALMNINVPAAPKPASEPNVNSPKPKTVKP
jgi:hypothetical protein